jgi:hypothetical protein
MKRLTIEISAEGIAYTLNIDGEMQRRVYEADVDEDDVFRLLDGHIDPAFREPDEADGDTDDEDNDGMEDWNDAHPFLAAIGVADDDFDVTDAEEALSPFVFMDLVRAFISAE